MEQIINKNGKNFFCTVGERVYFVEFDRHQSFYKLGYIIGSVTDGFNFVTYITHYNLGRRFGKQIQSKIKKQLPKYNCTYENPQNLLRFSNKEDAQKFCQEVYLTNMILLNLK